MTVADQQMPDGGAVDGPRRSPLLAVWAMLTGLLTVVVGFAVFGMGMAFCNATASGTGAAGVFVGLWTVMAVRGVARRRPRTLVGLCLAWLWFIGRVLVDSPATVTSAVVLGSLTAGISLPLGMLWLALIAFGGPVALVRAIGVYRASRRDPAPGKRRAVLPVGVRLALLVAITLAVPHWVWDARGREIAELAERYALAADAVRKPVEFGACGVLFLGYESTRESSKAGKTEAQRQAIYERTLGDALADLEAMAAAGARYVRVGASGDHLFVPNEAQEPADDRYMEAVRRTGIPVVFVDCQHPQALGRQLGWDEFCRFQRQRIEYYQRRYHPRVYIVVCEPLTYHQGLLVREATFSADAWAEQLSEMCRLVKSIDATTRTGICLLVAEEKKPEWEVWSRMRDVPELDILGVEIYVPEDFARTQQRLEQFGHPREVGKAFWIAETYNGWVLCDKRRWEQDVAWLQVAADYAQTVDAEAMLVWTFGCFIPGGSFNDFIQGRLRAPWEAAGELSTVGQAFASLARGGS